MSVKSSVLRSVGRIATDEISSLLGIHHAPSGLREKNSVEISLFENSILSLRFGGYSLAVAKENQLVIVPISSGSTEHSGDESTPKAFLIQDVENVADIEWINFSHGIASDPPLCSDTFLSLGTSDGVLLVYSLQGLLLVRQMIHRGPILSLRVQCFQSSSNWTESRQELCVTFPDCVGLVDCVELQSTLSKHQASLTVPKHLPAGTAQAPVGITFRKFLVRKGMGPQRDAVLGLFNEGNLFGLKNLPPQYTVLSLGKDPTMSFSRIPKHPSASKKTQSAARIASRVTENVAMAASSLYSLGKISMQKAPKLGQDLGLPAWSTRAAGAIITSAGLSQSEGGNPSKTLTLDPRVYQSGETACPLVSWSDPPREGTELALGSTQGRGFGGQVAATDRLGRVLLVDLEKRAVVRVWKGYRDATCAFVEWPAVTQEDQPGPREAPAGAVCLAILAPLKGLLEIWQLPYGDRLAAVRCGLHCRLLQTGPSLNPPLNPRAKPPTGQKFSPSRVFLLHSQGGHLWEILLPQGLSQSQRLYPLRSPAPGSHPPTDSALFQAACDLLRHRARALMSAQAMLRSAEGGEPPETQGEEEVQSMEAEEERVLVELVGRIRAPGRQVKALELLTSLRPSLSPQAHQAAMAASLLNLNQMLSHAQTETRTETASAGQRAWRKGRSRGPGGVGPAPPIRQSPADVGQSEAAVVRGLTAQYLRRRAPGGGLGLDVGVGVSEEAEGEGAEVDADVAEEVVEVSERREVQEGYRARLTERLGVLRWQVHLAKVYRMLTEGEGAPVGTACRKLPGRRGWDFGEDLREWWSVGLAWVNEGQAESSRVKMTSVEFVGSFRCDPHSSPPDWEASGEALFGELEANKEAPPGVSGMEESLGRVFFAPLADPGGLTGVDRVLLAMRLVHLTGVDFQRLFLAWLEAAPFPALLGMNPDALYVLVRRMGCSYEESRQAGADIARQGKGARWPLLLAWCQVSEASEKVLLLARTASLAADVAVEELGGQVDQWDSNTWQDMQWGEEDWLQDGAEQWREAARLAERSFWMGRAVRCVLQQSGARHLAHRARRGPSLAELAQFPAATWIARLELMITSEADELASLAKGLHATSARAMADRAGGKKLSSSRGEKRLLSAEELKQLLAQLFLHFPGSCDQDSLAAHRATELCRDWAAGAPGGDLLLSAQGQLAIISTVGLKGGSTAAMWHALIGPRAATLVSLVQRAASGLNLSRELLEAVGAYEQLLALLYDCAMLAESGAMDEPGVAEREDQVAAGDATCRDAIVDFRLRPPNSDRVYAYMLLTRVVGLALGLGLEGVDLEGMFSQEVVRNFPALFQDSGDLSKKGHHVHSPSEKSKKTRLEFLQAALDRQKEVFNRDDLATFRDSNYAAMSISSLAGDLGISPHLLRR